MSYVLQTVTAVGCVRKGVRCEEASVRWQHMFRTGMVVGSDG